LKAKNDFFSLEKVSNQKLLNYNVVDRVELYNFGRACLVGLGFGSGSCSSVGALMNAGGAVF
jgi:hypothetical protein